MNPEEISAVLEQASFGPDGLLPVVIQEEPGGSVLMLAWMDAEAMRRTFAEGLVTFWSRSRKEYWRKGDTSGNRLRVRRAALDCDADALLIVVDPVSAACHTGAHSCFDVAPLPMGREGRSV